MIKFIFSKVITIPNILSVFRIILAFLMLIVHKSGMDEANHQLVTLFLLSGISDIADGWIARKFNMISELGKILDPIADKLTQGFVLLCLWSRHSWIKVMFILFLVENLLISIIGLKAIQKNYQNDGAMWFGKLNTVIFYLVIFILFFNPDLSTEITSILIFASMFCMAASSVLYFKKYITILKAD